MKLGIGKSDFGIRIADQKGCPINLEDLSQDRLKKLVSLVSETRKNKYKRNRKKKYGTLNKGFTDEELTKFFSFCNNPKAYLSFFLMANLGLRVGEVVKIKIADLDFNKNKIRIFTEKAKTIDFMHLHDKVRIPLKRWVRKYPSEIEENEGYIFFSHLPNRKHISKAWLRKEFREVCKVANLDESYGIAEDINNPLQKNRGDRKLHRLTTHSLRHYFITRVYGACKDPLKTQKLARHSEFKSTETYIHVNQEELDKTIQDVFGFESSGDTGEVKEFLTFFKMWRSMKDGS